MKPVGHHMDSFLFQAAHAVRKKDRQAPLLLIWYILDIFDADEMVGESRILLLLTKIMSDNVARCVLKPVRSVVI